MQSQSQIEKSQISSGPSQALARAAGRAEAVTAQRRSGNGSIEDVADFFGVSLRTVASWKKDDKKERKNDASIGHFQIGNSVWFSAENVSSFAIDHFHASKFSKTPAAEVKAQVAREWREFLQSQSSNLKFEIELKELRERVHALEVVFGRKEAA